MIQSWLLKIQVYFLRRPKFRVWAQLEDRKYDFIQAVEDSSNSLPEIMYGYLSTVLLFPVNFSKVPWQEVFKTFYRLHSLSSAIRKIPITANRDVNKETKDAWDYSGRLWPLYMNIIASAYGWTEKQIASLDVNNALAYLQEILTDKQLDKEFIWSTSEIAYPYDKTTKKSKFQALKRPYWMDKPRILPKSKPIPKSLLPVGNVMRLIPNEKKTKEIKS